jgi:hypothetical protein
LGSSGAERVSRRLRWRGWGGAAEDVRLPVDTWSGDEDAW